MKRFIAPALVALTLLLATPALALGFGISPPAIELEVPADGSAVATFYVTSDFDGSLEVSLEDIPLRVEPTTIPVSETDVNRKVELTLYGDESLGSQVFNGKIRFLGVTGGTVATGIKVKATINHIAAGEPLPQEAPPEAAPAPPEQAPPAPPAPQAETEGFPIIPVAVIAAVTAIVITTVVVRARRRRY